MRNFRHEEIKIFIEGKRERPEEKLNRFDGKLVLCGLKWLDLTFREK